MDGYAAEAGNASRSAVIHQAINLLGEVALEQACTAGWAEWDKSSDAELRETATADGATDAPR